MGTALQPAIDICRATSNGNRVQLWESAHGPVPDGMRVGWTCGVPYCSKFEHMILAINKNSLDDNWKPYVDRCRQLGPEEWVEFSDIPHYKLPKFRTRLMMAMGAAHILIRKLPYGGCRVIRHGEYFQSIKEFQAVHRVVMDRMKVWLRCAICNTPFLVYANVHESGRRFCSKVCSGINSRTLIYRPSTFFLGFLSNQSLHRDAVPRRAVCSEKGCVFPVCDKGLCHRHLNFAQYAVAMRGARLDRRLLYSDDSTAKSNPHPQLSAMQGWEIKDSHLNTYFVRQGSVDNHWKLTEDYLFSAAKAAASEAKADILRYVRVTREKLLEYVPEDAALNSQGRGTRGGHCGSHKKVRKLQRQRPSGWHGSRPKHDVVKRYTRDKLDDLPMWNPADAPKVSFDDEWHDDSEMPETLTESGYFV